MGLAGVCELTAADIDHQCAGASLVGQLDSLRDRAGQVDLRTRRERSIRATMEDWHDDTATARSNACHAAAMLGEDHTGDVRAMFCQGSFCLEWLNQRDALRERPRDCRSLKARMREINWPVEHGDHYVGVARRFGPERLQAGEPIDGEA